MPSYHDMEIGNKIKIKLMDMDLPSRQQDLDGDLKLIKGLLDSVSKIKPEEDAKLQHLKSHIVAK